MKFANLLLGAFFIALLAAPAAAEGLLQRMDRLERENAELRVALEQANAELRGEIDRMRQPPRTSTYSAICKECANRRKRVDMGAHWFCALTNVASGGFNSGCSVAQNHGVWILTATDPDDSFTGQTQTCSAICIDPR